MREIVDGILTWPWFSETHGYDFNGHLIRDPGGNICVDPVEPTESDLEAIINEGVTRIILTNRNHSRAANLLRAQTNSQTTIHVDDANHARNQDTNIDDYLTLGERIGPLEVVGVFGKSSGEVALFWRDRGILIIGDAVIGNPPGRCGLLKEAVMDDPARLRRSLHQLLDLDFDILLFGDGVSILQEGKSRLMELVETFPEPNG